MLLTEDPGSSQQFPRPLAADPANATTARLWYVPFSGTPEVVAKVDQSADGGPTDVDGRAPGNWGAWESTGIVDASAAFGRGAFLINVQAHTLWVEKAPGDDNNGDGQPDFTYKREGGQLALIRIPGGVDHEPEKGGALGRPPSLTEWARRRTARAAARGRRRAVARTARSRRRRPPRAAA